MDNIIFWIVLGAVVVAWLVYRRLTTGADIPPSPLIVSGLYESAYGAALQSSAELPQRIHEFLSLPSLDPSQIRIETYVGDSAANSLRPLINYITSLAGDFGSLLAALRDADQLSDQKQKIVQAVRALLAHQDSLRSESRPDEIIIFVHYSLKLPPELSMATRTTIASLVRQLDTQEQAENFDAGRCLADVLTGNINVYPLALANTGWHDHTQFDAPKTTPIFEVRFMGLRGVFRYLLDEMAARNGLSFLHLDGDKL